MILKLADCRLRPFDYDDIDSLYKFRNDPEVIRSLGGFTTGLSKLALREWIDFHRNRKDEVLWCIADSDTNECFGHVGLYNIDHRVRKAELAIVLGERARRGRGLGKQVCGAAIEYGFSSLNLRRIELSLLANNEAARALYDSLGFTVEGQLRQAQFREGRYIDVILMALMSGDAKVS